MTNDDEKMFAVEQHKALSRRRFLKGTVVTVGAALASAGIYEMIDTLAQPPERPAFAATQPLLTVNPPIESEANVVQDVQKYAAYGHNGSMQPIVRQSTPTTTNYGETYPTGIAVSTRGDFDTLDNPFYYTSDPTGDRYSSQRAAGMHFLMFQPTIGNFNRTRLAMDGHYSDQTLPIAPRSHNAGFNSVLFTTHRQNYLVPPRRHRSFPLAGFLV
jgi:hypothetical protein